MYKLYYNEPIGFLFVAYNCQKCKFTFFYIQVKWLIEKLQAHFLEAPIWKLITFFAYLGARKIGIALDFSSNHASLYYYLPLNIVTNLSLKQVVNRTFTSD